MRAELKRIYYKEKKKLTKYGNDVNWLHCCDHFIVHTGT